MGKIIDVCGKIREMTNVIKANKSQFMEIVKGTVVNHNNFTHSLL